MAERNGGFNTGWSLPDGVELYDDINAVHMAEDAATAALVVSRA